MTSFGLAPVKQEGHTLNLETGESHTTTAAERDEAAKDTSTWMELQIDPIKDSREEIHQQVNEWLDAYLRNYIA